jgi:hypothetical protein
MTEQYPRANPRKLLPPYGNMLTIGFCRLLEYFDLVSCSLV